MITRIYEYALRGTILRHCHQAYSEDVPRLWIFADGELQLEGLLLLVFVSVH